MVVEEYVGDQSDSSDDMKDEFDLANKSSPSPIKIEEKKQSEASHGSAGAVGQGTKLIKVKTHLSIDDFGDLTEEAAK